LIVALAAAAGTGIAAAPAEGTALSYWGGPVLHSQQVVLVDWGSNVESNFTTNDPSFFMALQSLDGTTGDILGVLSQYADDLGPSGDGENSQNAVSWGGQYTITPAEGGNPSTLTSITDAQIQTELSNSIAAQTLPSPLDNGLGTIYVILFPQLDKITEPVAVGGGTSGINFCGYHYTAGTASSPLIYVVIADNGPPGTGDGSGPLFAAGGGCGAASTELADETTAIAHEFAESTNDPEAGLAGGLVKSPVGWYDTTAGQNGGEVADLCVTNDATEETTFTVSSTTWTVQNVWSNLDGACEGSEPTYSQPTAKITPPTGAVAGSAVSFSGAGSTDPTSDLIVSQPLLGQNLPFPIGPGIASYSWSWGDGSQPSTGASPDHTFASAAPYTVTLTVTDDLGFTATTSTQVMVSEPPPAVTTTTPAMSIADTSATLPGTINPNGNATTYQFEYGLSPTNLANLTTSTSAGSGTSLEDVSAMIAGLSPDTTYYYELVGTFNNTTYPGGVESFTTTGMKPPPPTPIASTSGASNLTPGGARLNGTVNPDGLTVTYQFAWGTSTEALTNLTASTPGPTGTSAMPVSASLSGLAPARTYYFKLEVTAGGETVSGSVLSFTTPAPQPGASIGKATGVKSKSATLTGTVDPNGFAAQYYFQFGTSTKYGHSTRLASAGAGTASEKVRGTISGLKPKTKYHYRLVVTSLGGTVMSSDATFKTNRRSRPAPHLSFTVRAGQRLAAGIRIRFGCNEACLAGFSARQPQGGFIEVAGTPIAVAIGSARLTHAGRGTAVLRLTAAGRALGRMHRSLHLLITGAATNGSGVTRLPVTASVAVR
jgi:hypothetical protein